MFKSAVRWFKALSMAGKIGVIAAGVVGLSAVSSSTNNNPQPAKQNNKSLSSNQSKQIKTSVRPICDGTTITSDCALDGVNYTTYVYHPAVPEKTHTETTTTYQKKVTGYCTLCNDGTYSPSCATGRGACSWHGGVQEWNAPEYENVPVTTTNTIVDAPAQAAYYEKVAQ